MKWVRLLVLFGCGLAVGCGGDPAPPTADSAAEQADEEAIKKAGTAERKGKPTTRPTRNPDDD
jgi:hypothetical protein